MSSPPNLQDEKEQERKSQETTTSTTTTAAPLKLFTRRTPPPPPPERSTTTYKPSSLADLFIHRDGVDKDDDVVAVEPTDTTTTTKAASVRSKFRPKRPLKDQPKSSSRPQLVDEDLEAGRQVKETNRISTSFKDRFKTQLKNVPIKADDVSAFLPADFKLTTSAPSDGGDTLLRELLSNLKTSDLKQLLPDSFANVEDDKPARRPSSRPSGGYR